MNRSRRRHIELLTLSLLVALGAPRDATGQTDAASRPTTDAFALLDVRETRESLGRWIRPCASELAFERIPWAPSLAEGIDRAARADKPLLLWVMNGHPLGCT